jgi:hypothetical protein
MYRPNWFVVGMLAVVMAAGGPAHAAKRSKTSKAPVAASAKKKPKTGKRVSGRLSAKARAKEAAKARAEARAKAEAEAIAGGKVAVFAFDGDEGEPVRRQVVRLLQANGVRVRTDLRPNDTAEQFRDMAAALDLAVYLHGRITDAPHGHSAVTVTLRSGVSGRAITSARFEGKRRELAPMVEQGLWEKMKSPLARACIEARKPSRRHNAPMRIEAGSPVEDQPLQAKGW